MRKDTEWLGIGRIIPLPGQWGGCAADGPSALVHGQRLAHDRECVGGIEGVCGWSLDQVTHGIRTDRRQAWGTIDDVGISRRREYMTGKVCLTDTNFIHRWILLLHQHPRAWQHGSRNRARYRRRSRPDGGLHELPGLGVLYFCPFVVLTMGSTLGIWAISIPRRARTNGGELRIATAARKDVDGCGTVGGQLA